MTGPRPWRSVRSRSTLLGVAVVTVALVVASAVLVAAMERSLARASDDRARSRAAELAALAADGVLPAEVSAIGDDSLAQVVGADGRVLAASPNIAGRPPVSRFLPSPAAVEVRTMRGLPDDDETEDYRVWAMRADTPQGPAVVYVGPSLEASQEVVARLVRQLLLGLPVLVALLAGALWFAVGRALAPIEAVRREVAAVSSTALDRRVPVPETGDEVAVLAETMNAMLARLEQADRRQRDFVADASHDLRTPLTTVRAELETALAAPERADWPALARTLLAETDRMAVLVDDLLFLARADSDDPARGAALLDLDDLVREEVAAVRRTRAARVRCRLTAAPVRGRREDLARMVRNLLLNAADHARAGVEVELAVVGDTVTLTVDDDGSGVPQDLAERVFERFVRGDASRSRAGTGLGLSIVRAVAEAHDGSAAWAGGSRFEVRLPLG